MDTSIKTPLCCECSKIMHSKRNECVDGAVGVVYECRNWQCSWYHKDQITDWKFNQRRTG